MTIGDNYCPVFTLFAGILYLRERLRNTYGQNRR